MNRSIAALVLCLLSSQAYAGTPSDEIMDSCLLFDRPVHSSISILPIDGPEALQDDDEVPGYTVFTPGFKSNSLRVGYATSKHGIEDFVMVGRHRGYISGAISLGPYKPQRIEPPERAFYAVVHKGAQQYVCIVASNGQGSAAFVRSAFVARIPLRRNTKLKLYFKVADIKKFKAFADGNHSSTDGH